MSSRQAQIFCWLGAALGIAGCIAGAMTEREQFFRSWWLAWIIWAGVALGGIPLTAIHFMTAGRWGVVARRPAEAAMMTLPILAVLFLPVCFGLPEVFPWARPGVLAAGSHKAAWLTPHAWEIRAAIYLIVLAMASFYLRLFSRAETQRDNRLDTRIRSGLGALAAVSYVLAMNFASTDWVMSLEPQWHSTIFAVIFMASQFLSTLALAVGCTMWNGARLLPLLTPLTRRDLGNLLLAFVVFWTYVSFSQFLIIWSGNLPREIAWYQQRSQGGWPQVAMGLAGLQFFVPFALLLSRRVKEATARLGAIAWLVCAMSSLHWVWLLVPSWHPEGVRLHWLDWSAWLALGGIFGAFFLRGLAALPAVTKGGHA